MPLGGRKNKGKKPAPMMQLDTTQDATQDAFEKSYAVRTGGHGEEVSLSLSLARARARALSLSRSLARSASHSVAHPLCVLGGARHGRRLQVQG